MTVRLWHLLAVGGLALVASTALLTFMLAGGDGKAATKTKTVAVLSVDLTPMQSERTAMRNVRWALPSMEAFYADNGSYVGATIPTLRQQYDTTIAPTVKVGWIQDESYCLESTVDGQTASVTRPDGQPAPGGC